MVMVDGKPVDSLWIDTRRLKVVAFIIDESGHLLRREYAVSPEMLYRLITKIVRTTPTNH
jgi:hypothetical protein